MVEWFRSCYWRIQKSVLGLWLTNCSKLNDECCEKKNVGANYNKRLILLQETWRKRADSFLNWISFAQVKNDTFLKVERTFATNLLVHNISTSVDEAGLVATGDPLSPFQLIFQTSSTKGALESEWWTPNKKLQSTIHTREKRGEDRQVTRMNPTRVQYNRHNRRRRYLWPWKTLRVTWI